MAAELLVNGREDHFGNPLATYGIHHLIEHTSKAAFVDLGHHALGQQVVQARNANDDADFAVGESLEHTLRGQFLGNGDSGAHIHRGHQRTHQREGVVQGQQNHHITVGVENMDLFRHCLHVVENVAVGQHHPLGSA